MKSATQVAFCMAAANAYVQGGGYYPQPYYTPQKSAVAPTSAYDPYDPRYPTSSRYASSSRYSPPMDSSRKPNPRYQRNSTPGYSSSRIKPIDRADYFTNTNQYNTKPKSQLRYSQNFVNGTKSLKQDYQKLLYPATHQVSTSTTYHHQHAYPATTPKPTPYQQPAYPKTAPTTPSYQQPASSLITPSILPSKSQTSVYPQTAQTSFQSSYPVWQEALASHSLKTGYQASPSLKKNAYGICEFKEIGASGIGGTIRFAQHPGYSVKVKGTLTGGSAVPNEDVVEFKITTLGDITGDCANMGSEFTPTFGSSNYNPWGQSSAVTNGSRITPVTFETTMQEFSQNNLLQNLAGEDSIIGLGLQLTDQSDGAILGCCTIGKDVYSADITNVHVTDD